MDGMWGMPGTMVFMTLFWVLAVVAIGAGIWWLVRSPRRVRHDAALDVLRERYARGEITREEFEARKRDLAA